MFLVSLHGVSKPNDMSLCVCVLSFRNELNMQSNWDMYPRSAQLAHRAFSRCGEDPGICIIIIVLAFRMMKKNSCIYVPLCSCLGSIYNIIATSEFTL